MPQGPLPTATVSITVLSDVLSLTPYHYYNQFIIRIEPVGSDLLTFKEVWDCYAGFRIGYLNK